jgi:hypothetical protein
MMTAAAVLGIDSCPIEGFNYDAFEETLSKNVLIFDKEKYSIAYAVCFGYRAKEQTKQLRLAMDEIVTFVE